MDAEKVKRLPVVDDLGRLVGIVTRGDLLKVHLRPDDDIRADVETGVLRRALGSAADAVTVAVDDGAVTLTGKVELASMAQEAARLTRQIPGVVEVVDELSYDYDDRADLGTGVAFGAA